MTRKHIGLIGCGQWGRFILRDLLSLGSQVTVVARSESTRQTALDGGAQGVVDRPANLPLVDGIIIATPMSTHGDLIGELLHRNVPVFTEKPLATNSGNARDLAAKGAGRLFVMDKWRYHPGVEMLAQIASSEELGPVLGIRTTRVGWGNKYLDVDAIWTLAPHDLSIALEILGTIPLPRCAVAEKAGDVPASLTGILGENPWLVVEVSSRCLVRQRALQLHCRDGVAVLSGAYSDYIEIAKGTDLRVSGAEPERRPVSTELPLLREIRAFLDYLNGAGPAPRSSAAEGAMIVDAIVALRQLAGIG